MKYQIIELAERQGEDDIFATWAIINIRKNKIVSKHASSADAHREVQMLIEDEAHPNF